MPFKKGQSGNPAGKPAGTKDKHPRTAKRAVLQLLEDFGNDVKLIRGVLTSGLQAKAPASFPYLKLVIEQNAGLPEQDVNIHTKVVHIHEPGR